MKKLFLALSLLLSAGLASAQTQVNNTSVQWNGPQYFKAGVPWHDVRGYGARPIGGDNFNSPVTTATTSAGNPAIAVASVGDFITKDGVVISKAGNPTSQSTPGSPTVTPLGVTGSSTISYECVGADQMEGLTAASAAGSTTTGPAVFGNQPVLISSITRVSDVVVVNFSAPINAAANEHIEIWNTSGGTTSFNGIFLISSAPSSTQIAFAQTGANESPTLLGNSAGRLVNGFVITSITRTNNIITVTTDVNHNFVVGSAQYPTVVQIAGVQPADLDGWYVVASTPTANTFTVATGYTVGANTETGIPWIGSATSGSLEWNTMGVKSWESNLVTCPVLSGTTYFYYIYANYGSGTYNLAGATIPGQNVWRDWGPFLQTTQRRAGANYTPPPAAAVPATAPSLPQNQEFVGTIASISGITFTLNQTVPTQVTSQNIFHDNSLAIQAADNDACKDDGSIVYFSGPSATNAQLGQYEYYAINAPFNFDSVGGCSNVQWYMGAPLWQNDTLTDGVSGLNIKYFSGGLQGPSGEQGSYAVIFGNANPFIYTTSENAQLNTDGIWIQNQGNGQLGIYSQGQYSRFSNTATLSNGVGSGLEVAGIFNNDMFNIIFDGYPNYVFSWAPSGSGGDAIDGSTIMSAPIGNIIVASTASIQFRGINNGSGKGIEFLDVGNNLPTFKDVIENIVTLQAPYTPSVFFYGSQEPYEVDISNITADSFGNAIFASLGGNAILNVVLDNNLGPQITGDPVRTLRVQNQAYGTFFVGQNINTVYDNANDSLSTGPYVATGPPTIAQSSETQQMQPIVFPLGSLTNGIIFESEVTGVTAVPSGVGTFSAGPHNVCVLPIGWNGGSGGLATGISLVNGNSPTSCANVIVNGSQGILISWNALSGVQGYDVDIDGQKMNEPVPLTGTSVTLTAFTNFQTQYQLPGTGTVILDATGLTTPRVRFGNALFKLDVTPGTLTANQTLALNSVPVTYNHSGVVVTTPHLFVDHGTLSGGTLTITLTGASVFTSTTTYTCNTNDTTTPGNVVTPTLTSGSSITFTGTGTDNFNYSCQGN